jgi:hypothetical protein
MLLLYCLRIIRETSCQKGKRIRSKTGCFWYEPNGTVPKRRGIAEHRFKTSNTERNCRAPFEDSNSTNSSGRRETLLPLRRYSLRRSSFNAADSAMIRRKHCTSQRCCMCPTLSVFHCCRYFSSDVPCSAPEFSSTPAGTFSFKKSLPWHHSLRWFNLLDSFIFGINFII